MAKQTILRKCSKCDRAIGSRWKCQHCDAINPTPEFWITVALVVPLVGFVLAIFFSVALA